MSVHWGVHLASPVDVCQSMTIWFKFPQSTGHIQELIDSKERPKKFGLSLLSALAQRDVRTAEAAMEAGADMKLVDDKGDTAVILIVRGSVMSCVFTYL